MSDWYTIDGEAVSGLPEVGDTNRLGTLEKKGHIYKPNFRSFGRFIRSEHVRQPTAKVAHAIARRAGDLSPRRKSGVTPPGAALADRFQVRREAGEMKVDGAFRVQVDVFNDARSAAPMEFGNDHTGRPGHRMLARAGAQYGDFKGGKRS